MRGLSLDLIGALIISLAMIVIGIGIAQSMGGDLGNVLPYKISQGISKSVDKLFFSRGFDVCESYNGKRIGYQDFLTLVNAVWKGDCKQSEVIINFALSTQAINELGGQIGANKVILGRSVPIGAGFLIVNGNPGDNPLAVGDRVSVKADGKPIADLLLEITLRGCNPSDNKCDVSCIYETDYDMADPLCYGASQDGVCDFKSVDKNQDGSISTADLDGICDPDCYNNITDNRRAYDPDCVQPAINPGAANDGVCDPDSNGVDDGVCDTDCGNSKTICDPNCAGDVACICGSADTANPRGIDGYCSPVCKSDASFPMNSNDWDCRVEFGNTWVAGDGTCHSNRTNELGAKENCENSADCPGSGVTCETLSGGTKTCAPLDNSADESGCAQAQLPEGGACTINAQCSNSLQCSNGHCCPADAAWDGTSCKKPEITFRLLIVPLNWDGNLNFEETAKFMGSYYLDRIPLSECRGQFELLIPEKTKYGDSWTADGNCDMTGITVPFDGNAYCSVYANNPANLQICRATAENSVCYKADVETITGQKIEGALGRIEKCGQEYGQKTGKVPQLVVGVDDNDIALGTPVTWTQTKCDPWIGGWTLPGKGMNSMIAQARTAREGAGVITHELGHKFDFAEQYCDCTGVIVNGKDMGDVFCGTRRTGLVINPLMSSLGCDGARSDCHRTRNGAYINSEINTYEQKSVVCASVFGNRDILSTDTNADGKLDRGDRTAMSNIALNLTSGEQGHYSSDEYNILKQDAWMRCK